MGEILPILAVVAVIIAVIIAVLSIINKLMLSEEGEVEKREVFCTCKDGKWSLADDRVSLSKISRMDSFSLYDFARFKEIELEYSQMSSDCDYVAPARLGVGRVTELKQGATCSRNELKVDKSDSDYYKLKGLVEAERRFGVDCEEIKYRVYILVVNNELLGIKVFRDKDFTDRLGRLNLPKWVDITFQGSSRTLVLFDELDKDRIKIAQSLNSYNVAYSIAHAAVMSEDGRLTASKYHLHVIKDLLIGSNSFEPGKSFEENEIVFSEYVEDDVSVFIYPSNY